MGQNFSTLKPPNALADMFSLPLLPIPQSPCYDPPQFFTSLSSLPKGAPPTAAPAPVIAPVAPFIPAQPAQPPALPQPYIKPRLLSPMQVDPANIPLPTPSTASHTTPHLSMSSPPSPRTQRIVQRMQQEAVTLASSSASCRDSLLFSSGQRRET